MLAHWLNGRLRRAALDCDAGANGCSFGVYERGEGLLSRADPALSEHSGFELELRLVRLRHV